MMICYVDCVTVIPSLCQHVITKSLDRGTNVDKSEFFVQTRCLRGGKHVLKAGFVAVKMKGSLHGMITMLQTKASVCGCL